MGANTSKHFHNFVSSALFNPSSKRQEKSPGIELGPPPTPHIHTHTPSDIGSALRDMTWLTLQHALTLHPPTPMPPCSPMQIPSAYFKLG